MDVLPDAELYVGSVRWHFGSNLDIVPWFLIDKGRSQDCLPLIIGAMTSCGLVFYYSLMPYYRGENRGGGSASPISKFMHITCSLFGA